MGIQSKKYSVISLLLNLNKIVSKLPPKSNPNRNKKNYETLIYGTNIYSVINLIHLNSLWTKMFLYTCKETS